MKKSFAVLMVIAMLCLPSGILPFAEQASAAGTSAVQAVYSSYNNTDTNNRLTAQPNKSLSPVTNAAADAVITIDPSITYQSWVGFGGSIEHDSIWELNRLSSADKASALQALFDPAAGNNYNLMRLSIACPDFCPDYDASISPDKGYWTYDDMPAGQTDPNLTNFSIQKDIDLGVISTLQQILQINPNVRFYASMWSPPAWMKDNGTIVNGGHVLPQYYQALANYYVKFIQAYQSYGIPIYAVTLQNEPDISVGYPSTLWTTDEQMNFAQVLGQTFAAGDIKAKIWGLDANEHVTFDYAKELVNPASSPYVDGFGFHNYTGQPITQSTALHAQYPDKTMHLTEITNGAAKLVDYFRNWMSSYTYWLTFIEFVPKTFDANGNRIAGGGPGPGFWQDTYRDPAQDPDFWVDSQVSWAGTPGNSTYKLNAWYYTFGQFSRFIQPGAIRIDSTGAIGTDVTNVAFKNPDGTIVAIVVNRTPGPNGSNATDSNTSAKTLKIVTPDGQFTDTIPGDTVATYKWTPVTGDALSKSGWSASASHTSGSYTATQAIDGNTDTVWTSGANEAAGQSFTLNLGAAQTFDQVSLNLGSLSSDAPVSYQLHVSDDGTNWGSPVASGTGTNHMTNIAFASQTRSYIRITLTGSASHWWSIADLSLYNSQSGLLPRNGWTATASSTNGSDTASQALDGSSSTRWANGTAQTADQWFQVDMGSAHTFNKISLDAGPNSGDQLRQYSVYASNDGVNWGTPIASGTGIGQDVQIYVPSRTARYLKVTQNGSDSNWWSIAEFRVYQAAPTLIDRSGWQVSASASGSGTTPDGALDGNLATRWANGAAQANGQWFQVDMGTINTISGMALNAGSFTGDYPQGYAVDASLDGVNWQRVAEGSVAAQDVMIAFPATFARYLKVTQTGTAASNWWSIAEINAFGVEKSPSMGTRISHAGWTATASHTEAGGNPGVAIDEWLQSPRVAPYSDPLDHSASRWSSGKSQSGDEWYQVDMGSSRTFNTLEINGGGSPSDYARSFTLYVSNDGTNWTPVASSAGPGPVQRVKFDTVNARYFNINQTGTAGNWWSIAEINLYLQ
ncbi:O-glycosyl hydrolase [Paenibacillus phyllosphaerae]|uniref:O-glycosyl hydrolase n=1 Tax=Paenibacillus phyllosphaerae TaxID=274593 RepID=A0A7W5B4Z7_9BACL|nr:discoidin domain-containing protein [Paenibacillus phyllosphaerae]MBB3114499.1 O-glycosyl hydrolase [Paenibacillus phyllosphaerae]